MLCLKPAHIIIMKKAPTLNDDEPVRSWAVETGGTGAGGWGNGSPIFWQVS